MAGPVFSGKIHRVSGVRDKSFYMLFIYLSSVFLRFLEFFHPDSGIFSMGFTLFTLTLEISPLLGVGDRTVPLRDRA